MKKILVKIDKKTGNPTISSEGVAGAACLLETKKLIDGFGIDPANIEHTQEFYNEQQSNQEIGGS